jgi:hypothetical protein
LRSPGKKQAHKSQNKSQNRKENTQRNTRAPRAPLDNSTAIELIIHLAVDEPPRSLHCDKTRIPRIHFDLDRRIMRADSLCIRHVMT